jgi:hypothetical protein
MNIDHQKILFDEIKSQIKGTDSLGNVIGEVLSISQDAVYRRYRGETPLTIAELQKLSKHFNISIDSLFDLANNNAVFNFQPLEGYDFTMDDYLRNLRDTLRLLKSQNNPELIISAMNMPFLQVLNYPHLVRFKLFFWAKTYLEIDEFKGKKFAYEKIDPKSFEIGFEALKIYNTIPSTEIYDSELLRGLAREIYLSATSEQFEDPSFAMYLYETMDRFIDHLEQQMVAGRKFVSTTEPPAAGCEYEVYLNDTPNPGTSILYKTDSSKGTFVGHNIMGTLHSTDEAYYNDTERILKRRMENSSLITNANERERERFFAVLRKLVNNYRTKLELELTTEL